MTRFYNSIPFSRDIAKTVSFYRDLVGIEPVQQYDHFVADDLDARFERISAEAPILHPIREVPHGERLFRCLDPDGHVVELGSGEHLADAEAAQQ